MSDDNKTNKELLEEVKKLRQLEEKRQEDEKKKNEIGTTEAVFRTGCAIIVVVPILIFIILFMQSFEGW